MFPSALSKTESPPRFFLRWRCPDRWRWARKGAGNASTSRKNKNNSCFSWSVTRCRCAQICAHFLGRNTNTRVLYSGRRYQAYLFRQAERANVLSILWLAAASISASLWSPRICRCWILMSNPSTTSDNRVRKTLQTEHRWLLFASVPFYASVWISVTVASRECPAAGSDTGDIFTLATLWAVYVGTEGQAATTAPFKASRQSRTNWPHAERHGSGSVCSNNPLLLFFFLGWFYVLPNIWLDFEEGSRDFVWALCRSNQTQDCSYCLCFEFCFFFDTPAHFLILVPAVPTNFKAKSGRFDHKNQLVMILCPLFCYLQITTIKDNDLQTLLLSLLLLP